MWRVGCFASVRGPMNPAWWKLGAARLLAVLSLWCASAAAADKSPALPLARGKPTAAEAKQFVERVEAELKRLNQRSATGEWIKSTYLTDDTERNAASLNAELSGTVTQAILEAARFEGLPLDQDTARKLHLLKLQATLPAPSDPQRRAELTALAARLEGLYGKGKWCPEGSSSAGGCLNLQQVESILKTSRSEPELRAAWAGWHQTAVQMRPLYTRLVRLVNEGAREIGFGDVGELWRAGYDLPPADIEREAARLWAETRPFYEALHCFVRGRLARRYGDAVVQPGRPIPAHLLGNLWAQSWDNVYPLVEPFPGASQLDLDRKLVEQNYDAQKMARLAESFFTSLGLDPLPKTFYQRSMFVKPRDREVVCHASAWDLTFEGDVRLKMCLQPTAQDLETLHHEEGHGYYSWYRRKLPFLYNAPANDGFDEAIGDTIVHSITPGYLKKTGLLDELPEGDKGLLNVQMRSALAKVPFLPFGLLVDKWRWEVFSGKTSEAHYNTAWWRLREELQGVTAPLPRTEADFDAGAKYHVASNTPYLRYFIAAILQYQLHRALCRAAGHEGPLHQCSIFGSKAAGDKLAALLSLGAKKPWQDALESLSGERTLDASALLDYYAPLRKWLDEQNEGRACGWR